MSVVGKRMIETLKAWRMDFCSCEQDHTCEPHAMIGDTRAMMNALDTAHAREAELVAALRELVDDTQKLYAAGRVPALTWIRASNLAALDSTGGAR